MNFSNSGIALLKQLEGFRAEPYKDQAGNLTVGYGTRTNSSQTVTEEQASELLLEATKATVSSLNGLVKVPLTQNQFDALVVFVYNIGVTAFTHSTFLTLLNERMYHSAAYQFLAWDHIHKDGELLVDRGLEDRRLAEKALFTKI